MVTLYDSGAENIGTNEVAVGSHMPESDTMNPHTRKHRPYTAGNLTSATPFVE